MQEEVIRTVMQMTGASAYTRQLDKMGASATNLSSNVSMLINRLPGIQTAIATAFGGLALGKIADIGSEFENTQMKLAGFMSALGLSENFAAGLAAADTVMRRIELKAAALPGEAEDYVKVFTTSLPAVQKAMGDASLDKMVNFTNQMAAIGATFRLDANQVANDLNRMLQVGRGGAGNDVSMFREMKPFLQQVEGQANMTNESFNKMTEVQRFKVLEQAMAKLQPMIDAATDSWDAQKGTVLATIKTMTRFATQPIFDGMKEGAKATAAALMDADGNLTMFGASTVALGQTVNTYVVEGVNKVVEGIKWLGENGAGIFDRLFSAHVEVFEQAFSFDPTTGTFMGPIADVTDTVVSALMRLSEVLLPLWDAFQMTRAMIEDVMINALPGIAEGIYSVLEPIFAFGGALFEVVSEVVEGLWPSMILMGEAIGELVSGIGAYLGPVLAYLGGEMLVLAGYVRDYVVPVLGFLFTQLSSFIKDLAEILKWMGGLVGKQTQVGVFAPKAREKGVLDKAVGPFKDFMAMFEAKRKALMTTEVGDIKGIKSNLKKAPPGATGGAKVTQDFRNSRFDIRQDFKEGFDPDRIAIAFAKSIQRLGEQRLQSGFEPAFAIR